MGLVPFTEDKREKKPNSLPTKWVPVSGRQSALDWCYENKVSSCPHAMNLIVTYCEKQLSDYTISFLIPLSQTMQCDRVQDGGFKSYLPGFD